jgi:two-component system sensor histidine kinase PilS (NtrC family)
VAAWFGRRNGLIEPVGRTSIVRGVAPSGGGLSVTRANCNGAAGWTLGKIVSNSGGIRVGEPRSSSRTQSIRTTATTVPSNENVDSRRDQTRPERIELNVWLAEFLAEFRQTSEVDERAIRMHGTPGDLDVRVDPSHLYQLLWNLCENALKYGRRGDDDAPVELHTGRISTSERPFLEIVDRGPGIATADAERIFEPFFTGSKGGTGLGLFIARELAQCNRAALIYEPRSGGGSIFRVVFADPQRWEIS